MPPYGALGLSIQDRPLRSVGASTSGQFLSEHSLRTLSQFDAHTSFSSSQFGDTLNSTASTQCRGGARNGGLSSTSLRPSLSRSKFPAPTGARILSPPVMALGRGGQDMTDKPKKITDMQALDVNWNHTPPPPESDPNPSWEQISMAFRIAYSLAMYGALAFMGNLICAVTGGELWPGGVDLSPEVITTGFGFAVPPMMALLFILEDEVVKSWPPARAIRDVEDEELMDFFVGMSPWQFPFVVAAGAMAEELFFRVAVQGGLTRALQFARVADPGAGDPVTVGLPALTGGLFVPFAQFFAVALTAALTGSMYYVMSSPKDPKYVVAPVTHGRHNRGDIKERVAAWYQRRQQKKIYSPLMEALLAMYLGFEWMHTGNILAPIITHFLYSLVVVGNGLRRIHDNREKLRQRVSKISGERMAREQGN